MDWHKQVQFVSGVPMPAEWAREFGITVNGMWDDHERWDRAAVEQAHREGRRVLIDRRLMALEAKYYERDENRHLLGETCRDIFGGKAEVELYFWDPKPVYSMCFYSRPFRDYLLAGYRRAVDIGIDILSLDVVMYQRDGAVVCHLLNYDYRGADDTIAPKRDVEISLPWAGGTTPAAVRWLTLAGEQSLDCRVAAGRLVFTVPSVDPYGLAVIE
ncbi:MAG: hypothetical protein ACE149_08285 [Armatimonadota bacterium]